MNKLSLNEIADALADYRYARASLKETKARVIEMAIELGMPQKAATSGMPQDFLDGYLVANGVKQAHRYDDE